MFLMHRLRSIKGLPRRCAETSHVIELRPHESFIHLRTFCSGPCIFGQNLCLTASHLATSVHHPHICHTRRKSRSISEVFCVFVGSRNFKIRQNLAMATASLKAIPSLPDHNLPLRHELPPEIINYIYEVVLKHDDVATVLPYPMPLIGTCYFADTGKTEHIVITNSCGVLRTCKASRNIYYSLLKDKVFNLDLRILRTFVEDLNFEAFGNGFLFPMLKTTKRKMATSGWRSSIRFPFDVNLKWTEGFLQRPKKQNLETWLAM